MSRVSLTASCGWGSAVVVRAQKRLRAFPRVAERDGLLGDVRAAYHLQLDQGRELVVVCRGSGADWVFVAVCVSECRDVGSGRGADFGAVG